MNITFEFCIFELPNFRLNWQFWFFGPNLPYRVFLVENWRSEHHSWSLHIWIRLSTKFQPKLTNLIFWIKFAQKGHFLSKRAKLNITIEFCLFELVNVPNFNLNWQFWHIRTHHFNTLSYTTGFSKFWVIRVCIT